VPDVHPLAGPTIAELQHGLDGQEFDAVMTAGTIHHDVTDIYQNAGYLDVTVDPPVFSPPREDHGRYAVDAAATVHPNALYHLAAINLNAAPPLTASDMGHATALRPGDPVSPMLYALGKAAIKRAYSGRGYLAAQVDSTSTTDASAHTVSDSFTIAPGPLFHLSRISVQAGLDELGKALQKDPHLAAGTVADDSMLQTARKILQDHHAPGNVLLRFVPDASNATAILVVQLVAHPSVQQ
jgi:outer membrane protein assembly factor BamA